MAKKSRLNLGTGTRSALTRASGGFSRYNLDETKGGYKPAKVTLPHADKLAEIGRKLEEGDVQQGG